MAAMQQFFDPNTESFGSPVAHRLSLALPTPRPPSTTSCALGTGSGTARTSSYAVPQGTPLSGNFNASITVSSGANGYAKINTIADILAACINSNGVGSTPDNCTTLFTNAVPQNRSTPRSTPTTRTPPSPSPPQRTPSRRPYYILSNPTQSQDNGATGKLHNLFSLASAQPPFTGLSSQPLDWTIHIYYNSSATCTANSGKTFLNTTIHQLATDALGHIWIAGALPAPTPSPKSPPTARPSAATGPAPSLPASASH